MDKEKVRYAKILMEMYPHIRQKIKYLDYRLMKMSYTSYMVYGEKLYNTMDTMLEIAIRLNKLKLLKGRLDEIIRICKTKSTNRKQIAEVFILLFFDGKWTTEYIEKTYSCETIFVIANNKVQRRELYKQRLTIA